MLRHGGATRCDGKGLDRLVVHKEAAAFLHVGKVAKRLGRFERHDAVRRAQIGNHGLDLITEPHDSGHRAAALGHAMNLGNLHVKPALLGSTGKQIGSENRALAANAAKKNRFRVRTHRVPS